MFRLTNAVCVDVDSVEEPAPALADLAGGGFDDEGYVARSHCALRNARLCSLTELDMAGHCIVSFRQHRPEVELAGGCIYYGRGGEIPAGDERAPALAQCEFATVSALPEARQGWVRNQVALVGRRQQNQLVLEYTTNPEHFDEGECVNRRNVRCCYDL